MSVLSLSLPTSQVKQIDQFTARYGFANRSEFFRSLIRFILHQPQVIASSATYPFVAPKTTSSTKILSDFRKTNRYSDQFLADLAASLKQSDYFTQ